MTSSKKAIIPMPVLVGRQAGSSVFEKMLPQWTAKLVSFITKFVMCSIPWKKTADADCEPRTGFDRAKGPDFLPCQVSWKILNSLPFLKVHLYGRL